MFSLRSWLGRHQTPLLGIDVSPSGLRLVELSRAGKGFRVAHCAQEPLPSGALRDGSFVQIETLIESLRRAVKASGTRLRTAAMALPSGVVIKKILTLPANLYDEDLEMQVEAEASQILPFPLDEISLDYATIGPSANDAGAIDVMLVAARKERIDERLALCEAAGLRPVVIDVESQAMSAGLSLTGTEALRKTDQPVALLQLGSESSHCHVILNGLVIFERELGVSLPRPDQEKSHTMVESLRETICQELSRALQLFATSTPHPAARQVGIAGSMAPLGDGLSGFLQRRLGVDVSLADPFAGLHVAAGGTRPTEDAPAWLLACGLTLRGFDS